MTTRHAVGSILSILFLLLAVQFAATAQTVKPFVTVDAARYQPAVAPDSIVSGFTIAVTNSNYVATEDVDSLTPGIQLPTSLGGLRVLVNNRLAELLFVGPNQINYIVPSATEVDATATVVVTNDQGTVLAQGDLYMAASSLNIFTQNQQGTGSPAAAFTADGLTYNQVNNSDGSTNNVPPGNYLVLFGTGVRDGKDVRAFIGGIEAQVDYAGAQPYYVALDQINLRIPEAVAGQGLLDVFITDGLTISNTVVVNVGGNPEAPTAAPVITSFGGTEVTAGQLVTVTGTQFPTTLAEASVKLGATPGQVVATSATSLTFIVPYGAATDKVTIGNASGARKSAATLPIKTSISGTVLDGNGAPLSGVSVSVTNAGIAASTDGTGRFLLTDVPRGIAQVELDMSSFPANLGLPTLTYTLVVTEGRDNEIGFPVYLPAGLGSSSLFNAVRAPGGFGYEAHAEADAPVIIEHDGLKLEIPGLVTFPKGAKEPRVGLTRLPADGRLPAPLPAKVYPSVIALITPIGTTFGAKGEGWATLYFPNPDKFPAGTTLDLYAFRPNVAPSGFAKKGTATVDDKGELIVAKGLIDAATIWFIGVPIDQVTFTNVSGQVVDSNDKPVAKARVFVRGRSAVTDQNGKFEIKGVRAKNDDELRVDAMFFTPAGNPLKAFKLVKAVVPGTTDAGILKLPAPPPLSILIRPSEAKTRPGATIDLTLSLSRKFSAPVTFQLVNEEGVKLEITPATITLEAGQMEASFKVKGDAPGKGTVVARLAAAVDDATPDNARKGFAVVYVLNPAPVLDAIRPASGASGSPFTLVGKGFGSEAAQNNVFFKQGDRIVSADPKALKLTPGTEALTLSGIVPGLRAGEAEVFLSVLRNSVLTEPSNKLKFIVTQAGAPKLETITPAAGLPGAIFTLTGVGLDPNPKSNGIFFKQGDKVLPVPVELLKVLSSSDDPTKPITIQGIVPRMPSGDAEVFAVVYRNSAPSETSNKLAFKVLAPEGARLDLIDPKEGGPGLAFTIKGSGFDPELRRNFVFFKKGDRFSQLDPAILKSDGKTFISGVVPRVMPGDYEVFVVTNLESVLATAGKLPGTASNGILFKVLPPPGAKLETIDPVEGLAGAAFTLKGSGWGTDAKNFRIVFKQGERFIMLEPANLKFDSSLIMGKVPNVAAGDYEVLVVTNLDLVPGSATTPSGTPSNALKFKVLAPPAPVLEAITPTEGVPGTGFKLTGKNFGPGMAVGFKMGTRLIGIAPERLKVSPTEIEGLLPLLPAGTAEVAVYYGEYQSSNALPFKFVSPPSAKLDSINPVEGKVATPFTIKGSGFGNDPKLFRVLFKQGDRLVILEPINLKTDGLVISGQVPNVVAGDYEIIVFTHLELPALLSGLPTGVPSNSLTFKVLGDTTTPAKPELLTISPTEGAPGTPFKLTGKNFIDGQVIYFRQGTKVITVAPATLKITPTAIEGILPPWPPGAAEVFVGFGNNETTNKLPFKFLLPPNFAKLDAINPTDMMPGGQFKVTGVNLAPFYDVAFKQGGKFTVVPRQLLKFTDGTMIEGVVPGLLPGAAEIAVGYGVEGAQLVSNLLPVRVLTVPSVTLEAMSSIDGKPEGIAGNEFKITGRNLAPFYTIVFKQGDRVIKLEAFSYRVVEGAIVGKLPELPAGGAEVTLALGAEGPVVANILGFTFKPKP